MMGFLAWLRRIGGSLVRGAREYLQFMWGPSADAPSPDTPPTRRRRFEGWTHPKYDTRDDDPRLTNR